MFGSSRTCRISLTICLVSLLSHVGYAQSGTRQSGNNGNAGPAAPEVTRELWQVLSQWADASARIQKLHGKHVRRAYDDTFKIEKISQGEFWYESPDKGRIDVVPVRITERMLEQRQDPSNRGVRRDKATGKPYELKSDLPERWLCDGEKVYDIDDQHKEAQVVVLPPDIRGANIMNSPLPFLFGMPPQKAIERFTMKLLRDYRPDYDVVLLEALPKMRKDAENWKRARIFLNTKTWLPSSVELLNPAGTRSTVYTFDKLEVNDDSIWKRLLGRGNPWDPKLSSDYKIHLIKPGQEEQAAKPATGGNAVPNVVGMAHDKATSLLLQNGVRAEQIKKRNAGPAPRQNLTYIVSAQHPKAGTPLRGNEEVVLMIFDTPARSAQGNGRPTTSRAQSKPVSR